MKMTKQEQELISYIRGLCFEDLLDAYEGLTIKAGDASAMATIKRREGDFRNALGFQERSNNLEKLAELLGCANKDYVYHIYPEHERSEIIMEESTAGEIVHLFEVMKKYGVTCSLEFKAEGNKDPLFGISNAPISLIEHFESQDYGNSAIVHLGEIEFNFEHPNNTFSKYVSDYQIEICIIGKDSNYAAWFNSDVIPSEGIEEAKNYDSKIGSDA